MSQSRIHDLVLLLGGMIAMPACTQPPIDPDDDAGVSPEEQDALDDALELCKPFGRKISACYAEVDGYDFGYVSAVGSCVAQVGYYAAESPDCGSAFADYFACLASLDCDDIFGEGDGAEEPGGEPAEPAVDPCEPEENALDDACGWGEDVDTAPESDSG